MKKDNHIIERLFFAFLKKECAYNEYKINRINDLAPLKLSDLAPLNYMICAFDWSRTQQGFEYWSDKDKKWRHLLNKNYSFISKNIQK